MAKFAISIIYIICIFTYEWPGFLEGKFLSFSVSCPSRSEAHPTCYLHVTGMKHYIIQ